MKIFFDTEFTGLHKNTTLISIGLVAENGEKFYAEFTDYDESQCDDWIKENVISKLFLNMQDECHIPGYHCGTKKFIKVALETWFKQFDSIELVSDVCHYDMVLLIDIFGSAFDLPKNICPVCYDINQDIAKYYKISTQEAFDKSREEILKEHYTVVNGDKHTALYDAEVIKAIYEILNNYHSFY